ncbi:MAG: hypothetical protein GTO54_12255 [Nitrososphaeria archaeon]|nr:hypothetical protein [Nitrososphaeria archaeon]
MFKVATEKINEWISFLSAISKITDEACFHVQDEKIWFRGMDPAHVSMIDFEVSKENFTEYEAGEETTTCILLEKLLAFVKKAKRGDKLEMLYKEKEGRLTVRVIGNYVKEFIVPLLDTVDRAPLKLPKVDFTSNIKMTTPAVKEALNDVKLVSEKVKIITSEDNLQLRGESEEGIEAAVTFSFSDIDILETELKEMSVATYNVELMSNVVRELERVSGVVTFSYGTDLPLKLGFEFPGQQKLDFYLAPRIED